MNPPSPSNPATLATQDFALLAIDVFDLLTLRAGISDAAHTAYEQRKYTENHKASLISICMRVCVFIFSLLIQLFIGNLKFIGQQHQPAIPFSLWSCRPRIIAQNQSN